MLLLAAAVLLAYGNGFQASFQFDDFAVIVDNPAVATLAAWWQSMPGIRPLLKLSYALNRQLPDGWMLLGFHAVNVAVHLGNVLLVAALARRLYQQQAGADAPHISADSAALLAALLFALHPVQTEAVTLISGRSMSLMCLFYLASIVLYVERRIAWSLLAWTAALAVRETALTLPLALWLVERQRAAAGESVTWVRLRPYAMLAGVALLLMACLPHYRHLAQVSLATRPLTDNLVNQSGAVLYLLRQWLWPLALNADPMLPIFQGWTAAWLLAVTACLAPLWWAARVFARSGVRTTLSAWLAFAVLWFAVHLAPTNSLLPRLDLANERHLYLASIGGCLLFGWMGMQWRARWRTPGATLLLVLLLLLGCLTQHRNAVYRDEVSFWRDVANKSPGNARAWNNLGYALTLEGKSLAAFAAYAQALALQPDEYLARLNQRALCRDQAAPGSDLARLCAGSAGAP